MIHPLLSINPLRTRADWRALMKELWRPLEPLCREGGSQVLYGELRVHYEKRAEALESFSRPLWGLIPLEIGGGLERSEETWELIARILSEGTDPASSGYWGDLHDTDTRIVEMAVWGFALFAIPGALWPRLSSKEQSRVAAWLGQVNAVSVQGNNWLFFRILVNLGLRAVGETWNPQAVTTDLACIDDLYIGDGWYSDGKKGHRDYYVPWAFHTYGLIFARYGADLDLQMAEKFRERARLFAPQFARWFAGNGAAIPFGRSLTYRFAQSAFFAALAFSETEALPWGAVKGLLARNLRWWLRQPIFDVSGKLTVGYGYPNPFMGEHYNSSGSPYWALKALLPLALPESHPFWQAEETAPPDDDEHSFQSSDTFLLKRDPVQGHVLMLNNHQSGQPFVRHANAKYAKFAYSTGFSFSYPMKEGSLEEGGFDNVLAVSADGNHWKIREKPLDCSRWGNALYSRWQPYPGWEIETWLLPALPGYAAIHRINAPENAHVYAGGFSLGYRDVYTEIETWRSFDQIGAQSHLARSVVRLLHGVGEGCVFRPEPNSHLLQPWICQIGFRCRLPKGSHIVAYIAAAWSTPIPNEADDFCGEFSFSVEDSPLLLRCNKPLWSQDSEGGG